MIAIHIEGKGKHGDAKLRFQFGYSGNRVRVMVEEPEGEAQGQWIEVSKAELAWVSGSLPNPPCETPDA